MNPTANPAARDTDAPERGLGGRVLGLYLLCAAVLLAGSWSTHVFDRDEARFALAVREMSARDDWILPTNWGEPRYHKPILAYGCALVSQRLFGANEFAWRLPSALAGLVTLGATLQLARRRFGAEVALRAGAILVTSLVFVVESKILTADALLLATGTLAFWAWIELREGRGPRRGWQLLFWTAVALGILAKGVNVAFLAAAGAALAFLHLAREPDGSRTRRRCLALLGLGSILAALPWTGFLGPILVASAALFLLARRSHAPRVALGAAWGLPLCAALVSLWLVPALLRSRGAFLSEGLGHHMLARSATPFEGHAGFPGYYLLVGVLAFFPWALRLPTALRKAWRDPRCEFFLAWILGPWVLLECVASKLPHYLLITLPAVAVLLAVHTKRPLLRPFVGACMLYLVAGFVLLPVYDAQRLSPRLGAEVARLARPGEAITLVGYRPASLGRSLPLGHPVVQEASAVAQSIALRRPGLYLVAQERAEDVRATGSEDWQRLGRVDGRDGWKRRAVELLRIAP